MIKTDIYDNIYEIIVPNEWENLTVASLFKNVFQAPKKLTHQFRIEKLVSVNDSYANWTNELTSGDRLQLQIFNDEPFPVIPQFQAINILYEDNHVIVVNKPCGMDTHPNQQGQINTLANGVAFYLQEKKEFRNVRHVHRLDKDTTGAILFSKHALAGALLDRMLQRRMVKRIYVAILHGILATQKGTINKPIGRDRHHPTRRRVSSTGKRAETKYEVIQTIADKKMSVVKCELITGRTHQIRVHFSYLGHPLVGDYLYGGKRMFPRQALHAISLQFPHPFTKEIIRCFAPPIDHPAIFPRLNMNDFM